MLFKIKYGLQWMHYFIESTNDVLTTVLFKKSTKTTNKFPVWIPHAYIMFIVYTESEVINNTRGILNCQ